MPQALPRVKQCRKIGFICELSSDKPSSFRPFIAVVKSGDLPRPSSGDARQKNTAPHCRRRQKNTRRTTWALFQRFCAECLDNMRENQNYLLQAGTADCFHAPLRHRSQPKERKKEQKLSLPYPTGNVMLISQGSIGKPLWNGIRWLVDILSIK